MKLTDLSEPTREKAREALYELIGFHSGLREQPDVKRIAERVAEAFIAMERYDSAPDVCDDGRDADHDGG